MVYRNRFLQTETLFFLGLAAPLGIGDIAGEYTILNYVSHQRAFVVRLRTIIGISMIFVAANVSINMDSMASLTEIPIPRSMAGDKGKYFLLEKQKNGDVVLVLHKRVGVESAGYTKTETNCVTMQMRELGYSEKSPSAIRKNPTKWFELIPGSSKSDLANFVCK